MNQKTRPIGVTLLAIFAGIAAFLAIVHTLQLLGLLPIPGPFGIVKFFTFNLIGAIMWGILAAIYIWVVKMLWSLDARGWLFLVMLSILNLVLIGISLLGQTTWQSVLPSLLINALILIYCLLPGTKEAFLPQEMSQPAVTKSTAPAHELETAVTEPEVESEPAATAMIENVDIEAETAAVAASVAAAEVVETEEKPVMDIPEPEPVAEAEPEPLEEEAVAESEPVAAMIENVNIEAETAVAAAAISADEIEEESVPATPAENIDASAHASRGEELKFGSQAEFIEGIGPAYSAKLQEVGIDSPQALLEAGATPEGRKELKEKTGISGKLILKWLNAADLYRIKGIGSEYADLLVAAGVNTVLELAQRNPGNLHQKLIEINEEKKRVREVPSLNKVTDWIKQAKELPRVMHY